MIMIDNPTTGQRSVKYTWLTYEYGKLCIDHFFCFEKFNKYCFHRAFLFINFFMDRFYRSGDDAKMLSENSRLMSLQRSISQMHRLPVTTI